MNKVEFIGKRTEIISKMLDNPNENGIYPTTICYAELDDLFDEILGSASKGNSWAQIEKNVVNKLDEELDKRTKSDALITILKCSQNAQKQVDDYNKMVNQIIKGFSFGTS